MSCMDDFTYLCMHVDKDEYTKAVSVTNKLISERMSNLIPKTLSMYIINPEFA